MSPSILFQTRLSETRYASVQLHFHLPQILGSEATSNGMLVPVNVNPDPGQWKDRHLAKGIPFLKSTLAERWKEELLCRFKARPIRFCDWPLIFWKEDDDARHYAWWCTMMMVVHSGVFSVFAPLQYKLHLMHGRSHFTILSERSTLRQCLCICLMLYYNKAISSCTFPCAATSDKINSVTIDYQGGTELFNPPLWGKASVQLENY